MLPTHHGPDAGLSVDMLQLDYEFSRIAEYGSPGNSWLHHSPLDLVISSNVVVDVACSASSSKPRTVFPSRALHLSGAMLDSTLIGDEERALLRCGRTLSFEPRKSTATAEARPGLSQPRQPNGHIVYQQSATNATLLSMDSEIEQTDLQYATFLQQLVAAPTSLIVRLRCLRFADARRQARWMLSAVDHSVKRTQHRSSCRSIRRRVEVDPQPPRTSLRAAFAVSGSCVARS